MLDNRNLNPADHQSWKLGHRFKGPFKIITKFGDNSFKLDLPGRMHIHATFHASLLKPYNPNNEELYPDHIQQPPDPISINNQLKYKIEKIIASRKHQNHKEYQIKWKGYGDHENS